MAWTTSGYERTVVASTFPFRDWWEQVRSHMRQKPQGFGALRIATGLNILALTCLAAHYLRTEYLFEPTQRAADSGLLTVLLAAILSASLLLALSVSKSGRAGPAEPLPATPPSLAESQSNHRVADIDAERRVTELMTQMGHELRTPLNAIIGFSEIMHHELLGPLGTTRYRSYAADIRDSGFALLEAVENTLSLTRSMAEPTAAPLHPAALRELIAEAMARATPDAEARGVSIDVSNAFQTPPTLPRVLQQVLTGVFRAAVSAAENDSTVIVESHFDGAAHSHPLITVRVDRPIVRVGMSPRPDEPLAIAVARTLLELQGGRLDVRHDAAGPLAFQIHLAR